jgi:putative Holliday junction resolvase
LLVYCLGLDVGERRIGVAIGEALARPLTTLTRHSYERDQETIGRLVREHKVETIVVGLPLNMDGSKGFQAQKVERYASELSTGLRELALDVEIVLWDERLSTEEAQRAMVDSGLSVGERRHRVDQVAATIILQSYLDHRAGSRSDSIPWTES